MLWALFRDIKFAICLKHLVHFLQPLVKDIFTGFIDGLRFKISYPSGIRVDRFWLCQEEIVRVLILCLTGDHPDKCEMRKFLKPGRCGCRRCKPIDNQLVNSSNTRVYCGENRYRFRYPWESRELKSSVSDLYDIE